VFTVDLDADSYDLAVRVLRTRIGRGLYTPITERAWHVLQQAIHEGPWWRLTMEREDAETLGDRWPDEDRILDAALRGARAVSAAIPYIVHTAGR